jgi:NAD(P)-dependent dehydrogenase (short-subunit alcohol dehydrogenase family)
MQLEGTVALITGGRRIGQIVAARLAARGADIALSYAHSRDDAERTAKSVRASGRRAEIIRADLAQAADCQAFVDGAADALGRVDVLLNMASVYVAHAFDDLTAADWDQSLAVDVRAAFLCTRAAVPHMRRNGGGRIINFSDWTARSGRPRYRGYLPYYVAKTAVIGLTEGLALELAPDNILVNAIAPGPIVAPDGLTDEERRAVEEATPLGRWGGADEIARAVLALLDSDFVTGETLRVDGGRHVK